MVSPQSSLIHLRSAIGERYWIERVAGNGGMAVVYAARDTHLNRRVAIKVLRPELASSVSAERFLREIRTAARLSHPNILALFDSGRADDLLYYVMPYVEGETLSERLRTNGPLDVSDATGIARAVAVALAYAHRVGIVHRDIKPENILLSGHGHVCLADFGLASACDAVANRRLTVSGMVIGSPAYMSPEQIKGRAAVDGRSDVYSLGCVLFEMLTGRPPFEGTSIQEVMHAHLFRPPPSLARLRPDVPEDIAGIVRSALEKSPEGRPESAELSRLFAVSRLTGADGAHASAANAALPGRAIRAPLPAATISLAVMPLRSISSDASYDYLSDALTEELICTLGQLEGIRVAARTSVFAFRNSGLTIAEIGARLDVAAVLEGSVRLTDDRVRISVQLVSVDDGFQHWSASYTGRLDDVFGLQEEVARNVATALVGKLNRSNETALARGFETASEAYNDYLLGRHHWHSRAPADLARAIECFKKAIAKDPGYARAHAGLADALLATSQFQYRRPHDVMPSAEAAARRAIELDPAHAEAQTTYAHILDTYHHRWDEAERTYRRAIRLNPRYPNARLWLGDLLTALGRFDEALPLGASAVELEPFDIATRFGHAVEHYRARNYETARRELLYTMEMAPTYFPSAIFLALVHCASGAPAAGLEVVQEIMRKIDPLPPFLLTMVGFCNAFVGNRSEAIAALRQLEAYGERIFVPAVNRALVHAALKEYDRAFELMEEALEERYGQFIFVAVDPAFDCLRHDRRLTRMVQRMGLAQG